MGKLLALDLSTNVGFATLERGTRPRFGTLTLSGPDLSFKLGALLTWLEDRYTVDRFDAMAWETPIKTPTDTVDLLELLIGLSAVCHAFAGSRCLPWRKVDVPTVKLALTGNSRATKDQMVYAARRTMNWEIHNDHEADAGAVGVVAYDQLWPKRPA